MRNQGFTLAEVLIATGIAGVLVLIVSTISTIGYTQLASMRERITAEENMNRLELLFRQTLGQAVDVSGTDLSIATSPYSVPSWTGGLAANFVWDQIGDTPTAWNVIGHFYRETGGSGLQTSTDGQGGTLMPTAIFYRRPESSGTSGVLFFNMGSSADMAPNYADPFIDRISYLEMQKNISATYNKVTSVRVRARVRYHDSAIFERTWCPALDITNNVAGCNNGAKFRDLDLEFTIMIRNNLLKAAGTAGLTGTTNEERAMGFLYFFRLISPVKD